MAFLVVDYGSSSCRAATVSTDGRLLSVSRIAVALDVAAGADGLAATVDIETAWDAVCRVVRLQREACREPIDAVAVAAVMAYVCSDASLRPLLPALSYADTRSASCAAELEKAPDAAYRYRLTGRRARSDLLAPKLLWLRVAQPALFARISRICGLKDEFVRRLTGVLVTDYAHADYTLCFSLQQRSFDAELCEAVGVRPRSFAAARSATAVAGTIQRGVAAELGLAAGTPVAVGSTDGTTGMYGCGVLNGNPVLVSGTTDVVMQAVRQPHGDAGRTLTINCAMQGEGFLAGGATGMSGGALAQIAALTGTDYGAIDSLSASVTAGAEGVVALPGFGGERAPYWDNGAAAGFYGLGLHHGAAHLLRAAMEATAYRLRRLLANLRQIAPAFPRLVIAGGGAQSSVWNQIRADILGVTLARSSQQESTLIGGAMFCRAAVDRQTTLQELGRQWLTHEAKWRPDAARTAEYARGFARFEQLMRLMSSGGAA